MPAGTLPSLQVNSASPLPERMRTVLPAAMPASFISSGFIVMVLTMASYSGVSLPTLICWPCLVVRPAFMTYRLPLIQCDLQAGSFLTFFTLSESAGAARRGCARACGARLNDHV